MNFTNQNSKSKEFAQSSENIDKDIIDTAFLKSCLNSILRDILTKYNLREDKKIIPMLDNISRFYVMYLSSFGYKICNESGKKILNSEHVIEALKQMNFNKHIKLLAENLPNEEKYIEKMKILTNVQLNEEDGTNIDKDNLKNIINKKKKRGSRKKNVFKDENEKEAIKKMQDEMYEEAKQALSLNQQNQISSSEIKLEENNNIYNLNNEMKISDNNNDYITQNMEDYEKCIFYHKNDENDINFD